MVRATIHDVQARLDALEHRIEAALVRARERPARPSEITDDHAAELREAEARARLQAQRCQALEEQVTGLEASLADAQQARAQAEELVDSARRETFLVLERLEAARREQVGSNLDSKLAEALQAKLLEVERLSSELAELRRSNEDWRTRARNHRRELDAIAPKLETAQTQLRELRQRDEATSKRVAELERTVTEQRRELEIAERRAKHMRERMLQG